METPFVTVVIPAWNAAATIREAVRSALAAGPPAPEVIVVDDGSTDGTAEAAAAAGATKVVRVPHGERAAARNAGIREARGRYVAFLDADDLRLPGSLARQVAALDGGAAWCYAPLLLAFPDGRPGPVRGRRVVGWPAPPGRPAREALLVSNFICPSGVVARRDFLEAAGGFDTSLVYIEDWDLWIRLAGRADPMFLPDPVGYLRLSAEPVASKHRRFGVAAAKRGILARERAAGRAVPADADSALAVEEAAMALAAGDERGASALRALLAGSIPGVVAQGPGAGPGLAPADGRSSPPLPPDFTCGLPGVRTIVGALADAAVLSTDLDGGLRPVRAFLGRLRGLLAGAPEACRRLADEVEAAALLPIARRGGGVGFSGRAAAAWLGLRSGFRTEGWRVLGRGARSLLAGR